MSQYHFTPGDYLDMIRADVERFLPSPASLPASRYYRPPARLFAVLCGRNFARYVDFGSA